MWFGEIQKARRKRKKKDSRRTLRTANPRRDVPGKNQLGHFQEGPRGSFQRYSYCTAIPRIPTLLTFSAYFARPQPGGLISPSLVSGAFTMKPRPSGESLSGLPAPQCHQARFYAGVIFQSMGSVNVPGCSCQPGKQSHKVLQVATHSYSVYLWTAPGSFKVFSLFFSFEKDSTHTKKSTSTAQCTDQKTEANVTTS